MIKVAIVGTGGISATHIEAILELKDRAKIVALVDIYPEKAESRNKQYELGAEVYDSHKKLLGNNNIDLVCVCTPPYTHADISIDFLNNGKHVICEKPMAPSLEECDRMLEAAQKSGKILSIIAQNRFRTPIMNLKYTLDTNKIGKILHAQIDSFWWRGHSYYDLWWRGTWGKEGGGCTLNHAVHHIDIMLWTMGMPKKITSVLSNAGHDNSEVEDISVSVFHYDKGALGQVVASVNHHGEDQQFVFQGEKARISMPWKVHASLARENGFPLDGRDEKLEQELTDYYHDLKELQYEHHVGQIDNVITAIENGTTPLITGQDGKNAIECITAIYKAGFSEQTVTLPIQKDDPFYKRESMLKSVKNFYEKTTVVENFADKEIVVGSSNKKEK